MTDDGQTEIEWLLSKFGDAIKLKVDSKMPANIENHFA